MTLRDRMSEYERELTELRAQVNSLELRIDYLEIAAGVGEKPKPRPLVQRAFPQGFHDRFELERAIESMFQCKNGHYRSYHMVETPGGVESYPYVMLGAIACVDIGDAQEQLRDLIYQTLHRLHGSHGTEPVTLYWRYAKQQRIEEVLEDRRYKIRTRVAIPGAAYGSVGAVVPEANEGGRFFELKEGVWPWPRTTAV